MSEQRDEHDNPNPPDLIEFVKKYLAHLSENAHTIHSLVLSVSYTDLSRDNTLFMGTHEGCSFNLRVAGVELDDFIRESLAEDEGSLEGFYDLERKTVN